MSRKNRSDTWKQIDQKTSEEHKEARKFLFQKILKNFDTSKQYYSSCDFQKYLDSNFNSNIHEMVFHLNSTGTRVILVCWRYKSVDHYILTTDFGRSNNNCSDAKEKETLMLNSFKSLKFLSDYHQAISETRELCDTDFEVKKKIRQRNPVNTVVAETTSNDETLPGKKNYLLAAKNTKSLSLVPPGFESPNNVDSILSKVASVSEIIREASISVLNITEEIDDLNQKIQFHTEEIERLKEIRNGKTESIRKVNEAISSLKKG